MKKIIFIIILIMSVSAVSYTAQGENYSINISNQGEIRGFLDLGENKIVFDNNKSEIEKTCIYGKKYFIQKQDCISNCTKKSYNCVLREDSCYYCIKEDSWFSKLIKNIKKWIKGIGKKDKEDKEEIKDIEKEVAKELIETSGQLDNPETTYQNLEKLIGNADSLRQLINLLAYVNEYCYRTGDITNYENEECKELKQLLKKKADQFKDEEFEGINPEDKDAFNKMLQLRALLMAYDKASGENTLFSQDNVNKVRRGIKKKAEKWWNKHVINADKTIAELWQDLALANAFTPVTWDSTGVYVENKNDTSIFGGKACDLKVDVWTKANRVVAAKLFELDICNPDPEKLENLMQQLMEKDNKGNLINTNGCDKLLNSKSGCKALRTGDLQTAYEKFYYNGEFESNNPDNLPKPPIDCNKTEKSSEKDEDPVEKDTSEEDAQEEDAQEETEQAELECSVNIYEDEIIGFDFEVEDCDKTHDELIECFMLCGHEPPLVYAEENEQEYFCYETAGGFIDKEVIIPCYQKPFPPEGISECITDCALEII